MTLKDPEINHMFHTYRAPTLPTRPRSGFSDWKTRRNCKRFYGGHFWHSTYDEGNFCCNCSERRDGEPQDGT